MAGWVAVDKRHDLVLLKLEIVPDSVESFTPGPVELRHRATDPRLRLVTRPNSASR